MSRTSMEIHRASVENPGRAATFRLECRGREVGEAALTLGLDGAAKNYVPDSDHVLFHNAVVLPGASDRIYFTAPSAPGRYEFICSVPGHFMTMRGVLFVE